MTPCQRDDIDLQNHKQKKRKKILEMKEKNIKMEKDFEEITQNVV